MKVSILKKNHNGTECQGPPLPADLPAGIGDEERKAINLRENAEDKRIEWDVEKEHPLEVEFSADEMAYLQAACEKISDEELPDDMWGTVEAIYNEISNA